MRRRTRFRFSTKDALQFVTALALFASQSGLFHRQDSPALNTGCAFTSSPRLQNDSVSLGTGKMLRCDARPQEYTANPCVVWRT
jgi:hypothetical protein